MVIDKIEYGISYLPENCLAYKKGYVYGAYKRNSETKKLLNVVEFFKTIEEVYEFVKNNREYSNGR